MTSIESLKAGDVTAALSKLKEEIREKPQSAELRVYLFQLFAITGEWNRALAQLKVASELSEDAKTMADAYQHILRCEALREEVFRHGRSPMLLGEPEPWMAKAIEAARLSCAGEHSQATQLRQEAYNDAPATGGVFTLREDAVQAEQPTEAANAPTHRFQWIADADSRIGPFAEVIVQGKYYWVPFQHIEQIQFHPVRDLRDYVWIPAELTWSGGGEMVGMLPVRYPDSQVNADGLIQLGRKTTWIQKDDETYFGLGQRILTTDDNDLSLLDIGSIVFDQQ